MASLPGAGWPSVAAESLPWDLPERGPVSRTARRRHRGPYEAALVPVIAAQTVHLPAETLAEIDEAGAEIARFDAELGAEIAPFAAVLLRSESAASSRIENLTASARAIAEAELRPGRPGNAPLVLANVAAMTAAVALAERIDADAVLAMHDALLRPSRPEIAGRWRTQQVWIGGGDHGPHGAAFVPPHHRHVPAAIEDLVAFIARDDVPVVAHAAIAHAQFETIHPFPDGNGRTGRALLHAHLRSKGLTRHVTVPVSAGLLADTAGYVDALTRYRDGDPVPIVERLARAGFAAIANGRRLVADLREIRRSWDDRIAARRGATAWRIADLLLRHPVVHAPFLAGELGIAGPNVYRSIAPLVDAGVLVPFSDTKRNQLWRSPEVLDALDGFAERAGRRTRG
jgi:Fic family protein